MKRVLCFVLTFVMMTSVLMTTVEIGVGASYETPVIDRDYAKYTVSIMAASEDGTYSIRYHD